MTPWLDDANVPDEVRRLLQAGTAPSRLAGPALERSRRRVAALSAVPAAAGAFFLLQLQQLALGAALGTAVSVGAFVGNRLLARPYGAQPQVDARTVPAPRAAPSGRRAPVLAPSIAPGGPPPERGHGPAPRPQLAPPAPSTSTSVTAEAALLEQARRLLASDPARALTILDEHAKRFSKGSLGVEREVLAVDALVHAGLQREAEARAERLRASAPGSLYEERLRRVLGN